MFVPPGCTGKVQPADVSWNAAFKRHLQELYDDWQFSAPKEFTRYGNPKPPSNALLMKWVKQAWDMVTPEIIAKSFKKCGISNAMDGCEDDLFDMADYEDEDFEGFSSTDVQDAEVHSANMLGTDNVQYEIDAESDIDSAHEEDMDYEAMSPGH